MEVKLKKRKYLYSIVVLLCIFGSISMGYYLPHKSNITSEIQMYQHDIYNLEAVRDLYRETLQENNIPIPEYIQKTPHIQVADRQSLVIIPLLGDSTYNWSEIFDSPEEASNYFVILHYIFGGYTEINPPDPYLYDKDAYPMLWEMSITLPADLDKETAIKIHSELESLGAWDNIRDTLEFWRIK